MNDIKLTTEQINSFYEIANPIIETENFQKLKHFMAHKTTSIYEHAINVAKLSFAKAVSKSNIDLVTLVRGALLHDYYFYDWHKNKPFTFHGFKHPKIALENAKKDFQLNKKEQNIIRSHMFPLTLFHYPKCKEAWLVTMCDKKIARLEIKGEKNAIHF